MSAMSLGLLATVAVLGPSPTTARPLEVVQSRGVLSMCAHPNALPFTSRRGEPPGFQIELGRALAERLGVQLAVEWVTTKYQFVTVDCDIVLDTIALAEVQAGRRLQLSKPYQRSGVALALRPGVDGIAGFADLNGSHRVGVRMGSLAARMLDQRGVRIVTFGFEDEMVEALARSEIDAAAVSPPTVGYFNLLNRDRSLRVIHAYDSEPELSWDLAVGLRRSDQALREAIDAAVEQLLANGTVTQIYRRYGVEHRLPSSRP
jgi:polar amino acid transport system substrate-binding protein